MRSDSNAVEKVMIPAYFWTASSSAERWARCADLYSSDHRSISCGGAGEGVDDSVAWDCVESLSPLLVQVVGLGKAVMIEMQLQVHISVEMEDVNLPDDPAEFGS